MTPLARCHGYVVEANDGEIGVVETPLFAPYAQKPDFVVIRIDGPTERFAAVPASLVASVEDSERRVRLAASRAEIGELPEHVPIEL